MCVLVMLEMFGRHCLQCVCVTNSIGLFSYISHTLWGITRFRYLQKFRAMWIQLMIHNLLNILIHFVPQKSNDSVQWSKIVISLLVNTRENKCWIKLDERIHCRLVSLQLCVCTQCTNNIGQNTQKFFLIFSISCSFFISKKKKKKKKKFNPNENGSWKQKKEQCWTGSWALIERRMNRSRN